MVKKLFIYVLLLVLLVFTLVGLKIVWIDKKLNPDEVKNYLLSSTQKHAIRLTFLGTSGFIIEYQNKQFVCDPFYSNPNILSTIFSKPEYPALNHFIKDSLFDNISMISISHGHYDHCMDIRSFIKDDKTVIVSDQNNQWMLHEAINKNPFHSIKYNTHNEWIYSTDSLFRILPIASVHAPHIANITFLDGAYERALDKFPEKLWHWKMGKCNSYLVDVMQKDSIVYRFAMLGGKTTAFSEQLLLKTCSERKCDLLAHIYWNKDRNYEDIIRFNTQLNPDVLLLHHWNSFFGSIYKPVQYFRTTQLPKMLEEFKSKNINAKIMMPFTSVNL